MVVRDWAKSAGIKKYVTFHTARHSFATMMLTLGANIYTTSKLLGHSNIRTTEIYAKIIDKKKDEAMGLIDKFFDKDYTLSVPTLSLCKVCNVCCKLCRDYYI